MNPLQKDLDGYEEKAAARAQQKGMTLEEYLAAQIYLSAEVLKGSVDVNDRYDDPDQLALAAAVMEVYEGSRILAEEVLDGVQ